jgi:hypothetical protein
LASARALGAPGRFVKSARRCRADVDVRCARVRDPNGALGSLLETPGCAETVASGGDWCRSALGIRTRVVPNACHDASPGNGGTLMDARIDLAADLNDEDDEGLG